MSQKSLLPLVRRDVRLVSIRRAIREHDHHLRSKRSVTAGNRDMAISAERAQGHPTGRENSLVYRPDIDGIRAVAVLAVIAYHASPGAMPGGFVGVDVFFVISGFLITSLILRG